MSVHFGLKLISGPDNIRLFQLDASYGAWTAGDIVQLDSNGHVKYRTASTVDVDGTLEDAFGGVALTTQATDANAETNYTHVPIMVITPEQVWSIKVEDGMRANDYKEGLGYKIGYVGTAVDYDIDYASGGTSRTVSADEFYYLDNANEATEGHGCVVQAMPFKGQTGDADYGGRVHVRFGPLACQLWLG